MDELPLQQLKGRGRESQIEKHEQRLECWGKYDKFMQK